MSTSDVRTGDSAPELRIHHKRFPMSGRPVRVSAAANRILSAPSLSLAECISGILSHPQKRDGHCAPQADVRRPCKARRASVHSRLWHSGWIFLRGPGAARPSSCAPSAKPVSMSAREHSAFAPCELALEHEDSSLRVYVLRPLGFKSAGQVRSRSSETDNQHDFHGTLPDSTAGVTATSPMLRAKRRCCSSRTWSSARSV